MFALVRSLSGRVLITEQVPALVMSLVVAELFYKFHSFTLETIAFLATWFVFDALGNAVRHRSDQSGPDDRRP